jgi:hypothetical protein
MALPLYRLAWPASASSRSVRLRDDPLDELGDVGKSSITPRPAARQHAFGRLSFDHRALDQDRRVRGHQHLRARELVAGLEAERRAE